MTVSILSILLGVIAKDEIHIQKLHHQITGVGSGLISIGVVGLIAVTVITALQVYARNYKYAHLYDLFILIVVIGYILQLETLHLDIHRIPFHALGYDMVYVGASGVVAVSMVALSKIFMILRKQYGYHGNAGVSTDERPSPTDVSLA